MVFDIFIDSLIFFTSAACILTQMVGRYYSLISTGVYGCSTESKWYFDASMHNLILIIVTGARIFTNTLTTETIVMFVVAFLYTWANIAFSSWVDVMTKNGMFDRMKEVHER